MWVCPRREHDAPRGASWGRCAWRRSAGRGRLAQAAQQPALPSGGILAMDNALGGGLVQLADRLAGRRLTTRRIGRGGLPRQANHTADTGAHHPVAEPARAVLSDAFLCRSKVGQQALQKSLRDATRYFSRCGPGCPGGSLLAASPRRTSGNSRRPPQRIPFAPGPAARADRDGHPVCRKHRQTTGSVPHPLAPSPRCGALSESGALRSPTGVLREGGRSLRGAGGRRPPAPLDHIPAPCPASRVCHTAPGRGGARGGGRKDNASLHWMDARRSRLICMGTQSGGAWIQDQGCSARGWAWGTSRFRMLHPSLTKGQRPASHHRTSGDTRLPPRRSLRGRRPPLPGRSRPPDRD